MQILYFYSWYLKVAESAVLVWSSVTLGLLHRITQRTGKRLKERLHDIKLLAELGTW